MSSGICERCGDASGERHLCVPPFLDRGSVTYNASSPPPRITPEATAAEVRALQAENARLRQDLVRVLDDYAEECASEWSMSRPEFDVRMAALLDGPAPPLAAENARLRALVARYADVIGDDARDVLPGVPF